MKGGELVGDWTDVEALREVMYFTWGDNIGLAEELLRIIQTYDVRLVMSGHVHRDMIYILNGENYVTTGNSGGGGPEGYEGPRSRLIELDSTGAIRLGEYAEAGLFDPPNAIPTGELSYYYWGANDGSGEAVSARVVNGLEMALEDASLAFLSSENPVDAYSFYPRDPGSYDVVETDAGYLYVVHVDVTAGGVYDLTLAMDADSVGPSVEIGFPDELPDGDIVNFTIGLTDSGWGVMDVEASYSLDGGSSWTEFDIVVSATVNRDEYVVNLRDASIALDVNVSIAQIGAMLMVRAEATDFAGNLGSSERSFALGVAPSATYILSVDSSPVSGVSVTVDGEEYESPVAAELEEGSHSVVVPDEVTMDGVEYEFTGWADAERSVSLSGDLDLEAVYEEVVAEEPDPSSSPEPSPKPESPSGGIPISYASVAAGLLLGVAVLFLFRRR